MFLVILMFDGKAVVFNDVTKDFGVKVVCCGFAEEDISKLGTDSGPNRDYNSSYIYSSN